MQLIARYDVADYDAFREAFDGDREAIGRAGLRQLQIWRGADSPTRVFILFEVVDRDRAEDVVSGTRATLLSEKGGVEAAEHHFVTTA